MGNDIPLALRISVDLDTLRANLAEGVNQIETTKSALKAMAASFDGSTLIARAGAMTQGITEIGGASALTAAEQAKANVVLTEAIAKYEALGRQAPPAMLALAEATKKVPEAFGEWTGKFDIQKAISDPLGTAKEGLGAFVETLGPAGVALTLAATAAAAVGGALIELGTESEAIGASIGRMGQQFNIPVGAVSDLRFAVKAAGGDFDTFGNSMFTFQKRIEDNGDAVGKGLEKIGLSLNAVKAMRPDEQFLAISDALRSSGDETNKAAVAFEIFGKQGRDILPLLLKPLSDLTEESAKLGATWTDVDVAAARAFGAAQTKMAAEAEEAWTSLGRAVAPTTDALVLGWDRMKLAVANVANLLPAAADAIRHVTGSTGDLEIAQQSLAAAQDATNALFRIAAKEGLTYGDQVTEVATKMLNMGYSQKTVAEQTGLMTSKVKELAGELKATQNAADDYTAVWEKITKAFSTVTPSITGVSASTKGLVADMLAVGVSLKDIATATGLNVEQIKLIEKANTAAAESAKQFAAATAEVNSAGAGWKGTLDSIDGAVVENMRDLTAAGVSIKTLETYYGLSATQGKAFTDMLKEEGTATKALAEEAKKFAAAQAEVDSAGQGWKGTLNSIDGAVVENMRDLTAAGVSIKTLEEYYGLTATQGKAFTDMLKDESTELKRNEQSILAITQLWDEYAAVVGSDSGSAYDKAGAAIDKWYDDTVAKHVAAKTDTAAFYVAVAALDDAKWAHLNLNTLQADGSTKAHYQLIADKAKEAYDFASAHGDQYTVERMAQLQKESDAAQLALSQWGVAADTALKTTGNAADDATKKLKQTTDGLAAATKAAQLFTMQSQASQGDLAAKAKASGGEVALDSYGNPYVRMPGSPEAGDRYNQAEVIAAPALHRAGGGAVDAGQTYTVGERGPETLVMGGQSGSILPNGVGGGVTNNFYVNGTGADVARVVMAEITKSMRQSRQFPAA